MHVFSERPAIAIVQTPPQGELPARLGEATITPPSAVTPTTVVEQSTSAAEGTGIGVSVDPPETSIPAHHIDKVGAVVMQASSELTPDNPSPSRSTPPAEQTSPPSAAGGAGGGRVPPDDILPVAGGGAPGEEPEPGRQQQNVSSAGNKTTSSEITHHTAHTSDPEVVPPASDRSQPTEEAGSGTHELPAGTSGSGSIAPPDKSPTERAKTPELGASHGALEVPLPSGRLEQTAAAPVRADVATLMGEAAALSVQLKPEDAERIRSTVRPAGVAEVYPDRSEKLAAAAAVWGVYTDPAAIEAATHTLYVEDRGPQPSEHHDRNAPPVIPDTALSAREAPVMNASGQDRVVQPWEGPHDVESMRRMALERLQAADPSDRDEPSPVALARRRLLRESAYELGRIVGPRNVSKLTPPHMQLLRELAPAAVRQAVTDRKLDLMANALGVGVSAHEIRNRLLWSIGDALPKEVPYVKPDLPLVTEGLTVGTRLDEFARLAGVRRSYIAQQIGMDLTHLGSFLTGGRHVVSETVQKIMEVLNLPPQLARGLLELYNWERKQYNPRKD